MARNCFSAGEVLFGPKNLILKCSEGFGCGLFFLKLEPWVLGLTFPILGLTFLVLVSAFLKGLFFKRAKMEVPAPKVCEFQRPKCEPERPGCGL